MAAKPLKGADNLKTCCNILKGPTSYPSLHHFANSKLVKAITMASFDKICTKMDLTFIYSKIIPNNLKKMCYNNSCPSYENKSIHPNCLCIKDNNA